MKFVKKHFKYLKKFKKLKKQIDYGFYFLRVVDKENWKDISFHSVKLYNYSLYQYQKIKNIYQIRTQGIDFYIQCPESQAEFLEGLCIDLIENLEPIKHSYDKFIIYGYSVENSELIYYFKNGVWINNSLSNKLQVKEKRFILNKNPMKYKYIGNNIVYYHSDLLYRKVSSDLNEVNLKDCKNALAEIRLLPMSKNEPFLKFRGGKLLSKEYKKKDCFIPDIAYYGDGKRIFNYKNEEIKELIGDLKITNPFKLLDSDSKEKDILLLNYEQE